ncbi:MAG: response regulator [Magnetococcales bacterium]|nr:response regulator [Magnetococcales bacterium]
MDKNTDQETFLTTREASKILGVALPTVQGWVEKGILRAWKTAGGHRRIARSSLDKMLHERQVALAKGPDSQAHPAPPTLLVVEDDPAMVALYRSQIQTWSFEVDLVTASNGFDALIQIGRKQPGIIISDLVMPGMDGFRMIWILNEKPELADTRIVVVSALDKREIQRQGGLPDKVTVFRKPAPMDQLKAIVGERSVVM